MMLRICRAKARRYIPSLRVGFCSAALQGGIGCKQCRHTERVWNLLDEGSAFRRCPTFAFWRWDLVLPLRVPHPSRFVRRVGTALVTQGARRSLTGPWGIWVWRTSHANAWVVIPTESASGQPPDLVLPLRVPHPSRSVRRVGTALAAQGARRSLTGPWGICLFACWVGDANCCCRAEKSRFLARKSWASGAFARQQSPRRFFGLKESEAP